MLSVLPRPAESSSSTTLSGRVSSTARRTGQRVRTVSAPCTASMNADDVSTGADAPAAEDGDVSVGPRGAAQVRGVAVEGADRLRHLVERGHGAELHRLP